MTSVIQFALLGLGIGGVYSLAAEGVVLVFRGSRVLNFAHGAVALVAAITYFELLKAGAPIAVAFVAGLAVSGIAGILIQLLVMRPLRATSPVTRLVATLGVLAVVRSVAALHYGDRSYFTSEILPTHTWTVDGIGIQADRLTLLGIAATLTIGLWAIYRWTTFGLATSAVAENTRATAALGRSPSRIALTNWMLGCSLAGLAGILLVPTVGMSVNALTLVVFPAMAAALVGGFASFPLTFLGALVIGIAEAETTRFVSTPGWTTAVPFIVIIAALVARGRSLPLRSHVVERLPRLGGGDMRPIPTFVFLCIGVTTILALKGNWLDAATTTLIGAIMGISLVVVTGYAGQLSLAQFALAGAGAFVAARMSADLGISFLPSLSIGVSAALVLGGLVALPALRVRGVSVAISTLGLALVIQTVWLGNPNYTGGFGGLSIQPPDVFGWNVDPIAHPERYAFLCLTFVIVSATAVANLRRGRSGRRLASVRTNERAAATLGISVVGSKLYAFAIAGGIAGLAGTLQAFRTHYVFFDQFQLQNSIDLIVLMIVSGVGFVSGGILGGFAIQGGVTAYAMSLAGWDQYLPLILGVVLLVNLVLTPSGVAYQNLVMLRAVRRRVARRKVTPGDTKPHVSPGTLQRVRPRTLSVEGVSVAFGGVLALDNVSLRVEPGRVTGLIGPNGAGKTTLIDVATGITSSTGGRVLLDGRRIDRLSTVQRARIGIGRSLQALELFDDLTIRDNLRAAADEHHLLPYLTDLVWPGRSDLTPQTAALAQELGLAAHLERFPSELPYGRRRLVAIARSLAAFPSVLLLDEPAAGLDTGERDDLSRLIRRLADELGLAVLLVEHDVNLVLRTCDKITVLDFGKCIAAGTPHEIRRDQRVVNAFLGRPMPEEKSQSDLVAASKAQHAHEN